MSGKSSKKIGKVILWVVAGLMLLDLTIVGLLFVPAIQTRVVRTLTTSISNKWGSEFSIRDVRLTPSLKIVAHQVEIRDTRNQEMISVGTVRGRLRRFSLKPLRLHFGSLELDSARVVLRKYKGEESVNIALWAAHLKKENNTRSAFLLDIKKLKMSHSYFVLMVDDRRVVFDTQDHPDIDYGFLELADINFQSDDFVVRVNNVVTIATRFNHLALNQYGGFSMKDCQGDFSICDTSLVFNAMKLRTPESRLDLDLRFDYANWKRLGDFVDSVRITSTIRPSQLCLKDVAAFAPSLKGMDQTLMLQVERFEGPVRDFSLKGLTAHWGMFTDIKGDFAFRDITDFKHSHIRVQLDSSTVNVPDLAMFPLPKGKSIPMNHTLAKLGQTKLYGTFEGTPSLFDARFDLSTGVGDLTASLSTQYDGTAMQIDGTAASPNLHLGTLTNNRKLLGSTDFFVTLTGSMDAPEWCREGFQTLQAHLSGVVNRFDIYGYPLKNTRVEADYQDDTYACSLSARDKHFACDIDAMLDLTDQQPYLQGSVALDSMNAGKLANAIPHIDAAQAKGFDKLVAALQEHPEVRFGFDNFMIALRGSSLQDVNGYAACDNIRVHNEQYDLENEKFRLTAINNRDVHKFILSSNVANASLETTYDMKGLKDSLQGMAHLYFPNLVPAPATAVRAGDTLSSGYVKVHVNTYRTRSVLRLLMPDLFIAPNSTIDVTLGTGDSRDTISASVPFCMLRDKVKLYNLEVGGCSVNHTALNLNVQADSTVVMVKEANLPFEDIRLDVGMLQDTIHYNIKWRNNFTDGSNDTSNFNGFLSLSNPENVMIALRDSKVYLNNRMWYFNNENLICLQKKSVEVRHLVFTDSIGKIEVDGKYSKNTKERMTLNIREIDMSMFDPLLGRIQLDGALSAKVNLGNRNGKVYLYGNVLANDFMFNEAMIGDVYLGAVLDTTFRVTFNGGIFNDGTTGVTSLDGYSFRKFNSEKEIIAKVNGYYDQRRFTVHTQFDSLNVGFLQPFLSSFCDRFDGDASGKLSFYVTPDSAYFDGLVRANDVVMGIEPLGTRYHINDQDIRFNTEGIFFDNLAFQDDEANTAYLRGAVRHRLFQNMDVDLDIHTDRIAVLNTKRTVNSAFYGTGFAAGDVKIKGGSEEVYFLGPNLTTLSGTKISLQVNSANSASQSDVITFKPKPTAELLPGVNTQTSASSHANLMYDFTFNVTNEADVVLLLESIGGTMNARADGRFRLVYANEDLNLYGSLQLHSGDFKLALYDLVNSRFTLVPGGSIQFDGPLDNMTVSASAYKSSKTSLKNIIPQEYLSGNGVNVNAYLHLNGPLMQHIEPSFSFELPNSSSEVRNMFYTAIDTANTENITKQFAYFLVTNSFMPNEMFSSEPSGGFGVNMFSNILNNVLGNIMANRKGSFGVTYNQATETSSAEYGVKAGASLLNDRISLSTSIGYYDDRNTQALNNMYGDFSVEYSINKSGTWKLKAYTYIGERDENYSYDAQINYTAGVALAFRQDFNSLPARKKRNKQKGVKKDE